MIQKPPEYYHQNIQKGDEVEMYCCCSGREEATAAGLLDKGRNKWERVAASSSDPSKALLERMIRATVEAEQKASSGGLNNAIFNEDAFLHIDISILKQWLN